MLRHLKLRALGGLKTFRVFDPVAESGRRRSWLLILFLLTSDMHMRRPDVDVALIKYPYYALSGWA